MVTDVHAHEGGSWQRERERESAARMREYSLGDARARENVMNERDDCTVQGLTKDARQPEEKSTFEGRAMQAPKQCNSLLI